jgi:hypothetical protein
VTPGTISIERRYNGPPGSGNGGYTAGLVAALIGGPAEVTLRSPPPLERPLRVERVEDGGLAVRDGDELVAEARSVELRLDDPGPVAIADARAASRADAQRWSAAHPFPSCFVCGPERAAGDGLRIFPGRVGEGGLHAADWTPDRSLADASGAVASACVWAALDCPTSAPVANFETGPPMMLGRLAARLERPVEAGLPHALVSWPIGAEGRKREAGSALYSAAGDRLAVARAMWIELRQ